MRSQFEIVSARRSKVRQLSLYAIGEIGSGQNFAPGERPGYLFHLQTTKNPRKIKDSNFTRTFLKSVFETTSFLVLASS